MGPAALVPRDDLRRVTDAGERLVAAVGTLSDADARRASLLPGWTIGHVLTHIARNADSHCHRAEAALVGEVVDQYPGGYAARTAEIEAGATRSATELINDVRSTQAAMERAWRALPDAAWSQPSRDVSGRERRLRELPARRWQELEVHAVDLDIGLTHRDWPEEFVEVRLPALRRSLADRLAPSASPPAPGLLDERDELAWLYGRLRRHDLPELASWA